MAMACIAVFLLTSAAFPARADDAGDDIAIATDDPPLAPVPGDYYKITARALNEIKQGIQITGDLPSVAIIPDDAELGKAINDRIEAEYRNVIGISAATSRVSRFYFSYTVYEDKATGAVSILLRNASYYSGSTGIAGEAVVSINFNPITREILTVNGVLGDNGIKLANRVISDEVRANPDDYNPFPSAITDGHSFYVENGVMYLVFNKSVIAPGYKGIVAIPFEIAKKKDVVIPRDDYELRTNYNVRMFKLKTISDGLGLGLVWNEKQSSVDVYGDPECTVHLARFNIGKYQYYRSGSNVPVTLEAAPEIIGDRTYVPASFYDLLLGIPYTINTADGSVTFSRYVN